MKKTKLTRESNYAKSTKPENDQAGMQSKLCLASQLILF